MMFPLLKEKNRTGSLHRLGNGEQERREGGPRLREDEVPDYDLREAAEEEA